MATSLDTPSPRAVPGAASLGRARAAGRAAADRTVATLDRLIPLARRVGRAVRLYGVLVALAAITIFAVMAWGLLPGGPVSWVALAVIAAMLGTPPVVLLVFASVLRDVLELPARLREVPEIGRLHAADLAVLVREAKRRAPGEPPRAFPLDLWRTGKLLVSARGELLGWGVVMRLASVPFLVAVWIAFLLGLFELFAAPALVVAVAVLELV